MSGPGREPGKIYVSRTMDQVLVKAQDEAKQMKDEYISVEHLFLGILDETQNTQLRKFFQTFQITKEKVLQILTRVRGNQRVTSNTPEDTYEALTKYGTELVEDAALEISRRVMQLEIEEAALRKETDQASKDRLGNLQKELADLKEKMTAMSSKWENEKKAIHLDKILHQRVIGQNEAVDRVTDAIIRARAGIEDPRRPIGSPIPTAGRWILKTQLL